MSEGSRPKSPFSVGTHGGWRTTLALRDGLTRPQSCAVGAESVKDGTGGIRGVQDFGVLRRERGEVGRPQPWTRRGALQDGQLVPPRKVLEHEGALGPDTTEEACEDQGDHAGHHRSGRPTVQC